MKTKNLLEGLGARDLEIIAEAVTIVKSERGNDECDVKKNQNVLLTVADIAVIFHVTPQTVRLWVKKAKLGNCGFPFPLDLPGQRLLWDKDSIDEYKRSVKKQ